MRWRIGLLSILLDGAFYSSRVVFAASGEFIAMNGGVISP
jgi:hypothetical protein